MLFDENIVYKDGKGKSFNSPNNVYFGVDYHDEFPDIVDVDDAELRNSAIQKHLLRLTRHVQRYANHALAEFLDEFVSAYL